MKKTLLVLSMLGTSAALMAQENTQTRIDDGRMAAQDMLKAVSTPALPIKQTYVPDEIMDRVTGTYGEKLYSIKQVKSGSGENVYQVTLIDNSESSVAWVGENGSEVAYVYRTDETEMMANTEKANTTTTDAATTVDLNTTTAPAVDDNTTDNNTLNTTDETPMENSGTETIAPVENTGNEPVENTEKPNTEATLPPTNSTNTNTNTTKPDGDQ